MNSKMVFLSFWAGLLILAAACGSPNIPTSTPIPTRAPTVAPSLTPTSTPMPTIMAITPAELKGFFKKEDLIAAYCKADSNDETFTLFLLAGSNVEQSTFPRIQSALFDREGNIFRVFGPDARATLLGNLVFGPWYISKASVSRFASLGLLSPEERSIIFPKDYELLLPQEKINRLLKEIVSKRKERSPASALDSDALAKEIWGSLFPPVKDTDIPLEAQIQVLEIEYLENVVQRGVILNFGPRPDGAQDYEVLKGSRGADAKLAVEVFERMPNPNHPFPKITSLAIQGFENLAPRQRLFFYGAKSGGNIQVLTRGAISSIYSDSSSMAINASVAAGDAGAHIFSLKCGMPSFVGMLIGSRQSEGKETQAVALGIEEILRFVKDNTGLAVSTTTSEGIAAEPDPVLKERLIAALTNGEYDFTFDLCFLKDQCLPKELDQWLVTFQNILVDRDDSSKVQIIATMGKAVVLGEYVAVLAPAIFASSLSGNSADGAVYTHRILWGETVEENGSDRSKYEYVEFVGFDSTRSVALFKRPDDTRFPVSHATPFSLGISKELKVRHALYEIGSADFRSFALVPFPVLRHANDIAYVAGFTPQRADKFYFQGGGEADTGGALCALRDGECEIIGFVYGDFDKPMEETLGTALTVEFVLGAVREIACANKIFSLCAERDQKLAMAPATHSVEALKDRKDIVALLKDNYPASPLLFDLLGQDTDAVIQHTGQIVSFMVDETGAMVKGSNATYRDSLVLSDEYVLTSSSFLPEARILSGTESTVDTSDLTSNVFLSDADGGKKVEVRIGLLREFIPEQEIFELLKKGGDAPGMEPLEVVLIDREHGYALLRRPSPHPDITALSGTPLRIIPERNMQTNQDIFIVFSKTTGVSKGVLTRIRLVSPGTITYITPNSSKFMLNAFISEENLGAPIYTDCGEHICLAGIASQAHSRPDLIQTEGFGLSIDFIFKEIKEKTGLDLSPEVKQ